MRMPQAALLQTTAVLMLTAKHRIASFQKAQFKPTQCWTTPMLAVREPMALSQQTQNQRQKWMRIRAEQVRMGLSKRKKSLSCHPAM